MSETDAAIYMLMAVIIPFIATLIVIPIYDNGGQAVWWGYPVICSPALGLFAVITFFTRIKLEPAKKNS